MTIEDAIFRNESAFVPANLNRHRDFWEHVILKDHPHKQTLLGWLPGVHIQEFMNSFTSAEFQGITIHSVLPEPAFFDNYVPAKFTAFMNQTIRGWETLGVIKKVQEKPVIVCPLGIEPNKPRAM